MGLGVGEPPLTMFIFSSSVKIDHLESRLNPEISCTFDHIVLMTMSVSRTEYAILDITLGHVFNHA